MAFGPASNTGVDLSPAESELRKAYTTLLTEVQRLGSAGWTRWFGAASLYNPDPFATLPPMPVLHIMARGRRVESGWYLPDKWENTGAKIANALGAQNVKQAHDEVFIAGEALSWHPEKLVELLIHQIIHQFSKEPSTSTHHSVGMGRMARYVGYNTIEKHPTQGHVIWKDARGDLATVIMTVAQSINPAAFSVYRKDDGVAEGTGRMKQWQCGCKKPKVYTGGVLFMTCDKCSKPLAYSHKDRMLGDMFYHLVARKALPVERIASWRCGVCGNDHDYVGASPYALKSMPNYPYACFTQTGVKP